MKLYANKHRTERAFKVGDWVYRKLHKYKQAIARGGKDHKLAARYYGPSKILKNVGEVSYHLLLPLEARIHIVFHVSLLKKKIGEHTSQGVLPVMGDDRDATTPLHILDRKIAKKGNQAITKLLVQWSDSRVGGATWEE